MLIISIISAVIIIAISLILYYNRKPIIESIEVVRQRRIDYILTNPWIEEPISKQDYGGWYWYIIKYPDFELVFVITHMTLPFVQIKIDDERVDNHMSIEQQLEFCEIMRNYIYDHDSIKETHPKYGMHLNYIRRGIEDLQVKLDKRNEDEKLNKGI